MQANRDDNVVRRLYVISVFIGLISRIAADGYIAIGVMSAITTNNDKSVSYADAVHFLAPEI